MKLTFIALCAATFIKVHEASIPRIQYFRPPNVTPHRSENNSKPVDTIGPIIYTKWLQLKVDNFNASDTKEWKMKYLVNEYFFENDGPIFIYVGGGEEISVTPLISGHFHDLAKKYKAAIFHTGYRYSGGSPSTLDLSTTSLEYLTSQQALADLAFFIKFLKKKERFRKSKVILHGESFSGTLVAWCRLLYPDLVDGGWASSAPLLASLDVKDFAYRLGSAVIERSDTSCYDRIINGMYQLEQLLKQPSEVKKRFQLCDKFDATSSLDISTLFLLIINAIATSLLQHTISSTCKSALQNSDNNLKTIMNIVQSTYNIQDCIEVSYNDTIKEIINPTSKRRYYYQLCNEFGWFLTYHKKVDLSFYSKICQDAFGGKYNLNYIVPNIRRTNSLYGGLYPNVTNIYFSQGELDLWKSLGHPRAFVIPGAMQNEDTFSISLTDSPEMRASKENIDQLIGKWIKL